MEQLSFPKRTGVFETRREFVEQWSRERDLEACLKETWKWFLSIQNKSWAAQMINSSVLEGAIVWCT